MGEPRRIASKDNPLLVRLRRLGGDPAAYRKLGQVWLEGDHLCDAYVRRGGRPVQAVLAERAVGDPALRALADRAAAVAIVDDALLPSISTLESPASIGFVIDWPGAGATLPAASTVVLDRLQDAGNVGTILRSAAAFGFAQVVALKGTAALWSTKVLRAGMGAHFGLHLVEQADAAALESLGVPLLATSSHATATIDRTPLPWPCAWVFGHEGQGVAPALQARCREVLRIPQPGGEESLNAAAAAAVCLYESSRQRALST
jgi:TrmH family RNA methyltransferase